MRLLCLHCQTITEIKQGQAMSGCPACLDSVHEPADADDTVTLTITRHELRILTMWADNYARSIVKYPNCEDSSDVIRGITDRLAIYTDAPLSLSQEIADIQAELPNSEIEVTRPDPNEHGA